MKNIVKKIHFIGIGGSGMSGIAELLLNLGYTISGSDLVINSSTKRLLNLGAKIKKGHSYENILGADVVVISTAVQGSNVEVVAARANQIPIVPRAEMLAELMRLKKGIAIAGTHGKTTTTSLAASVLAEAGLDPTFVIGGRLNSAGTNAKLGSGDYILAEADESDTSFLNLSPIIEVITNIDLDHMENFENNIEKLKDAFIDFTNKLPFYGLVIACIDDENIKQIIPSISKKLLTYGFSENADVRAIEPIAIGNYMEFKVLQEKYNPLNIRLNQTGMHNILNACAVIAIARKLDISDTKIQKAFFEFSGVNRRFTRYENLSISMFCNFTLIDDYGHHPVEISATIKATRGAYPGRRIILVFQPHRYTRTKNLFKDFVKVLSDVDVLILSEVYSAGEKYIPYADSLALLNAIRIKKKFGLIYANSIDEITKILLETIKNNDVILNMGAGSIANVPANLQKKLFSFLKK